MSTDPEDMLSSPAADVSTDGSSLTSTAMRDSRTACKSIKLHIPAGPFTLPPTNSRSHAACDGILKHKRS